MPTDCPEPAKKPSTWRRMVSGYKAVRALAKGKPTKATKKRRKDPVREANKRAMQRRPRRAPGSSR